MKRRPRIKSYVEIVHLAASCSGSILEKPRTLRGFSLHYTLVIRGRETDMHKPQENSSNEVERVFR